MQTEEATADVTQIERKKIVKERIGVVVSNKMNKTVVVAVESRSAHSKYGKIVVRTKRYKAHDETNECQEGDRVRILETRPLSKTKCWRVAQVLQSVSAAKVTVVAKPIEPEVESVTAPVKPEGGES